MSVNGPTLIRLLVTTPLLPTRYRRVRSAHGRASAFPWLTTINNELVFRQTQATGNAKTLVVASLGDTMTVG